MGLSDRAPFRLTGFLVLIMGLQPIFGLLFPEQYRDPAWIQAAWFANDCVTLIVAVPLLGVALGLARQDSMRGLLLWLGILTYSAYNYAYYLFGAALSRFFGFYVVAFVLSIVTLVLALARVDTSRVAVNFDQSTPARVIGGFFACVGISLATIWLVLWVAYAFAGRPTPVDAEVFKLVAALDLSIVVPLLTIGGVMLWRRDSYGYIVAAMGGIQSSLYLTVLTVGSAVAISRGLKDSPGELPLWSTLATFMTTATVVLLAHATGRAPRR